MKKEKLLKKALNNPRGLAHGEFINLVETFGFQYRRTTGSHEIYRNEEFRRSISIQPQKDGKAKDYQVRDFIEILEEYDVI